MSRAPRLLIATLAIGLVVPGFFLAAPTSVAAVGCESDNHVAGDLDSDGLADIVVGVPSYNDDRGAVDILFSGGERRFVRATDLGLTSAPGDRFGESVALGDINNDGCADLAIGAPGRNSSVGSAYLVRSDGDRNLTLINQFNGSAAHGSFGAQVLLLTPEKLTGGGWVRTGQQLVVSAPTADDGAASEAGHVVVLPLTSSGALAASRVTLTQNSAGVPGTSENFDRFGTALAGQDYTIVVGAPNEAIGTRTDAGSVTFLSSTEANQTTFAGTAINQDSTGIPGTAESGDEFGAAVAFRDNHTLIGVPGENIGPDSDTGSVHVVHYAPSTHHYQSIKSISQDSAGIPGANEDGDLFGSSVALGINTVDQLTAIVGAPGEAIGSVRNAGSVTMFRANTSSIGSTLSVRQGIAGISGAPESGDRFGASVSIVTGDLDAGESMVDGVVIGAPGEDIGSTADAGAVIYTRSDQQLVHPAARGHRSGHSR